MDHIYAHYQNDSRLTTSLSEKLMKFVHVQGVYWPRVKEPGHCYLCGDTWDDFHFKTVFRLLVVDSDGREFEAGTVKIMTQGMPEGRVKIPESFDALGDQYCSLGQDQNYYEQLVSLPGNLGAEILQALRDCVADEAIWSAFRDEKALQISLLRYITPQTVEVKFRSILGGMATPSHFRFLFQETTSDPLFRIEINVVPNAIPPTNVHVIIGRNGVGKTRLLAGLANALTEVSDPSSIGLKGEVIFPEENEESGRFSNLVTVAFSAFDLFTPIDQKKISGDIKYSYVGLKEEDNIELNSGTGDSRFKNINKLSKEFSKSLSVCLTGPRRNRWIEVIKILNGDPGFADLGLEVLDITDDDERKKVIEIFKRLSSGHKIVLLTATRLVELVDERTLVLIDEPESHLHPPLLGSFVRALSNLLTNRNGVALVATHSPVVLQEIPSNCVSIIRRTGEVMTINRPSIETFAENVGRLTYEVFQLEVTESGFYRMLAEAASSMSYEQLMEEFKERIGAEGRAIARILTITNNAGRSE